MRIDPDVIEASRPDDREIALLAAEVRRLQAVINSEEPTLTDEERRAVGHFAREFKGKNAATLRSLLERTSETNHDAVPAATAPSSDREDDPSSHRGTGNTQEPAAWWFKCDEYESVTLLKEHADAMAEPYRTTPVPLYRSPAITDAEREAIAAGLGALERLYEDSLPISQPIYEQHAPTLRSLLARLSPPAK